MRILVLLVMLAFPIVANAGEFYFSGAMGQTRFEPSVPDGTWYQQAFPHQFTKQDLGWKAGLGYAINEHWAIETHYVNFGYMTFRGQWTTSDANYNPTTHTVIANADGTQPATWWGQGSDTTRGGSMVVKYTHRVWELDPFLTGGWWIGHHSLNVSVDSYRYTDSCGNVFTNPPGGYAAHSFSSSGLLFGGTVGGGICYRQVCGQVDYYHAFAQSGFPVATSVIMPTVGVRIPLF